MIGRIGDGNLHWIDLLNGSGKRELFEQTESQQLTSERLLSSQQVVGRTTSSHVRRGAAALCAITMGLLWWQLAASVSPGKIFGVYSMSVFSLLVIASYFLSWGIYFAISCQSVSGKVLNFGLTTLTLLIIVGLLELPSMIGLIDYRNVISPPANYVITKLKPWDNPANVLDEELMHIHRPGQRITGETKGDLVNWLGISTDRRYAVDVQFDSRGFRNDHEIEKAAMVVLGDSFIEGILVSQPDLVSSKLRDNLHVEVTNLGQSGYGPQQELAVLRRFGLKLTPKVVLWFFFEGNDLLDVPRYERFKRDWEDIARKRNSFSERSFTRNVLFTLEGFTAGRKSDDLEARRRSCKFSRGPGVETLYFAYLANALSNEDLVSLDKAQNDFLQAQKLSKDIGAQLLLIYVPTKLRVYANYCECPADGLVKSAELNDLPQKMEAWSKVRGVSYLDLTPALRERAARGELVYFTDDGHWNANGHLVAAGTITKYLESRGWFAKQNALGIKN